MSTDTPAPAGLLPPEGTPAGAKFYIRHPTDGLLIRAWEPQTNDPNYSGPYWMRERHTDGKPWHDFNPHSTYARSCTLLVPIPGPEDLARHYNHVRELQEANSALVEAGRAATADAAQKEAAFLNAARSAVEAHSRAT